MAVINIALSPTAYGGDYSALGSIGWGKNLQASIPPNYGTGWAIWQIGASGIPAGQPVNALTVSGNNNYIVGTGTGITRTATLIGNCFNNYSQIPGQGGPVLQTVTGDGARKPLNVTLNPTGITSDDLLAGRFYFCVAASNSNAQASLGNGTFSYGALAVQIFTGPDGAAPPPSVPAGVWKNPASNNDPGALAGATFASCNYRLTQPSSLTFFTMQFQIFGTAGIRFANGTATSPFYTKGAQGTDPSHPYDQDTGILTVDAGVAPGSYSIRAQVSDIPGAGTLWDYSTLVVRAPTVHAGILLMEF